MRTRFAPTPSGSLHIGNAFSFIVTWLLARRRGGAILLRIDDLDADRTRTDFIADIFDNLDWLGLDWDEGPRDPDSFSAQWSQRQRLPLYREAIERLKATPGALFACACNRKRLSGLTRYPGTCRAKGLPLDAPGTKLRFIAPDGPTGDFIVWKRDDLPAYQLSSVVDDEHFAVTHIVRGADLCDSTTMQLLVARALKCDRFAAVRFLHHPLLIDRDGRKFSKSDGSLSLAALRRDGVRPAHIFRFVANALGLSVTIDTATDLLDAVDEERLYRLDIAQRGAAPIAVSLT